MSMTSYEKISNATKIALPLFSALIGYFQYQSEPSQFVAIIIGGTTVLIIITITLIDKLHSELLKTRENITTLLESGFSELSSALKLNFEYHGLLDSPKSFFNANEMREIWPLLVEKAKSQFLAINYLSLDAWTESNGDFLVPIIGAKVRYKNTIVKRIFVVDSVDEVFQWEKTFLIHYQYNIPLKYITKADFNKIMQEYARHDGMFSLTEGFNVIDTENPGIVVDWSYQERKGKGAYLKRGIGVAKQYSLFFDRVWDSRACIDPSLAHTKNTHIS